jgi:tetratricopeptide (TPR) repeat protein
MHEERDALRNSVLPMLEEELAPLGAHLEFVDLRMGVDTVDLADDHSKQDLVLKVCLSEVDRSRPFFVAMIGGRYGWIAPVDRAAAAVREVGFEGEWLEADWRGKSITELELAYALRTPPGVEIRSFFYFRRLPYDQMDDESKAAYSDKHAAVSPLLAETDRRAAARRWLQLCALKRRLKERSDVAKRCREYSAAWDAQNKRVTGLESFVQKVAQDLLSELRSSAVEPNAASEFEQLVADRTRGFAGREAILRKLIEHAVGEQAPAASGICLTGPPGAGKSAIFAKLYQALARHTRVLVLAHAPGTGPRSDEIDLMLEQWVARLSTELNIDNPVALIPEEKRARADDAFSNVLQQAAGRGRQIVLLVDALDQMEDTARARQLTWLPSPLPPNVRVIVTTRAEKAATSVTGRPDVVREELPPLDQAESAEVIAEVYRRYHREPNMDVTSLVLARRGGTADESGGTALWIRLAAEQLNLLDRDDFLRADLDDGGTDDERLHKLILREASLLPASVEGLYERMIDRAGSLHGRVIAQAFAGAISFARHGWRERDLARLVPLVAKAMHAGERLTWGALAFAGLRRAFRGHLVRRGAEMRWDFGHAQLRIAARRQFQTPAVQRAIHKKMASHLLSLAPHDPLRASEALHHLLLTEELSAAGAYYGGDLTDAEERNATVVLAARIKTDGPSLAISLLQDAPRSKLTALSLRFCSHLDAALDRLAVPLDARLTIASSVLDIAKATPDLNVRARLYLRLSALLNIGEIRRAQGELSAAHLALREGVGTAEELGALQGELTPGLSPTILYSASLALNRLGDLVRGEGDLDRALQLYRQALAIRRRVVEDMGDLLEPRLGLATSFQLVGDVARLGGRPHQAEVEYREAVRLGEDIVARRPGNAQAELVLSVSLTKLGDTKEMQGDFEAALVSFASALKTRRRLVADHPDNPDYLSKLKSALTKTANLYGRRLENDAEAISLFTQAREVAWRLANLQPRPDWLRGYAMVLHDIAEYHRGRSRFAEATRLHQEALSIQRNVAPAAAAQPEWMRDLSIGLNRLGMANAGAGDLDGARECFGESAEIMKKLVERHGRAQWRADLGQVMIYQAQLLYETGAYPGAKIAVGRALEIARELVARPEVSTDWIDLLAVATGLLGDITAKVGTTREILTIYEESASLFRSLVRKSALAPGWRRALARLLFGIGQRRQDVGDSSGARTAWTESVAEFRRLPETALLDGDVLRTYAKAAFALAMSSEVASEVRALLDEAHRALTRAGEALELSEEEMGLLKFIETGRSQT